MVDCRVGGWECAGSAAGGPLWAAMGMPINDMLVVMPAAC